jgi:tRNA-2-methylthio-N6-dimethylallyladenosine synthase
VKDRRLQELQALLRQQQSEFNAVCAGRIVDVLITGPGRRPGQIGGRTPWLQPVHLNGPESLIGRILPVQIVTGNPNSLVGTLIEELAGA